MAATIALVFMFTIAATWLILLGLAAGVAYKALRTDRAVQAHLDDDTAWQGEHNADRDCAMCDLLDSLPTYAPDRPEDGA
jgi:hypothetical protein